MPKWLKITLLTIMLFCFIFDIWYLYLLKNAPDKTVLTTMNVGTLNGVDAEDSKDIIKIKYFANLDGKGLELFDFQLNYLTNENSNDVISVGLQLIGNSKITPRLKRKSILKHDFWGWYVDHIEYNAEFDADVYTYAKYDNLSYTPVSNIDKDSEFLITIDEDNFLLGFKGVQTDEVLTNSGTTLDKQYAVYDINYLVYKLFNAVSGQQIKGGTQGRYKFQFDEDIFTYKKDVGSKVFKDIKDENEYVKITQKIVSNFSINIEVVERGALVAEDSLFNSIKKQANYNLTENVDIYDYHSKTQIVDLTENNFKFIQVDVDSYKLALTDVTKDYLKNFPNAKFNILINLDNSKLKNVKNIDSVVQDEILIASRVYKFQKCYTNSNNQLVYEEVTLS